MQYDVKDIQGKAVRKIDLPDEVFNVELREHPLYLAAKAYQANRRQGTHKTKTRAFVSGGGKKPFRQKGTGNARQGTTRANIHYGGAVSHGPQPRDYRQKLNRKARQLALRIAISDRVREGKLIVVDDLAVGGYSTKHIANALQAMGAGRNALISDERKDDLLYKSTRNIHGAAAVAPGDVNAEQVLRHEALVLSETAVTALAQRLKDGGAKA